MSSHCPLEFKPPRYTDRQLPPYSYVPGESPHPVSNPAGHMYAAKLETPAPLQPDAWRDAVEYLYGVDLFNQGYYWESHEAWESLWHAVQRKGVVADFLKGLIKLAAAGVKFREGNSQGMSRHASRAIELLRSVGRNQAAQGAKFCGVQLDQLIEAAESLSNQDTEFDILIQLDQD